MPIIIRDDGTPFVYYTTRETVADKKPGLVKQELRELHKENGNYARFFIKISGDVEAVFSTEPGYLLAESVWDYFNQPENMIFCEELLGGEKAILVVVKNGRVYFDAIMPTISLIDEFIILASESVQYQIYMFGDHLPLAEVSSDEKFAFHMDQVKSFSELDDSVFNRLEIDPALKLLSFSQALGELPGDSSRLKMAFFAIIVAGLGYFIYDYLNPPPPPVVVKHHVKLPPPDPFAQYKQLMDVPAVTDLLLTFGAKLRELYTIPGWQPTSANYDTHVISVTLVPTGGTAASLVLWLKKNDMVVTATSSNASLSIDTKLSNRPVPTKITNIRDAVVEVFDRMRAVLPQQAVQLGATVVSGQFAQTDLTLNISAVSPDVLLIVGRALQDLPVTMQGCSFSIQDGLLSGTIQIQVVGEKK